MSGVEIISERTVFPDGCSPDDPNAHYFAIRVTWRGEGRYSLDWSASQMSRAGNWSLGGPPQRMNRQQYRFTEDEALDWARRVVDTLSMNGVTWREMQERQAARQAGAS